MRYLSYLFDIHEIYMKDSDIYEILFIDIFFYIYEILSAIHNNEISMRYLWGID